MKRLLVLIPAAVVLGVLLGGFTLVGNTATTHAQVPVTITMASIPGEPASGVTGTTTIMDAAPNVIGTTAITGLSAIPTSAGGPPDKAAVILYSGKHCNPLQAIGLLVYLAEGSANQNAFHLVGLKGITGTDPGPLALGTLNGGTLVVDSLTASPWVGTTASVLSVGVSNLKNFDVNKTPRYPKALIQYLACGNTDGTPVYDIFSGSLLPNPVDQRPITPGDINLDGVVDTGDVHLDIDMVKDTNWCDTDGAGGDDIDATATHAVTDTYQVAVCLTSSPISPTGFNFNLVYDDVLNTCVVTSCGGDANCLDSNPDANTGVTMSSTPSLGTVGWNCNIQGVAPVCDKDVGTGPSAGLAFIQCMSGTPNQSDLTLPVGAGVSAPIAVLTFQANSIGTDTLMLDQLSVIQKGGGEIVACPPNEGDPNRCNNGTDIKAEATPVPPTDTPTPGPTATNTPIPPTATNTPSGVRMIKSPSAANIWVTKNGVCVDPELGKGCLYIDVTVSGAVDTDESDNDSNTDIEGVGAWEAQTRWDHKFISIVKELEDGPDSWLGSTGRQVMCMTSVVTEQSILEGCITKDVCVDAQGNPVLYPTPDLSGTPVPYTPVPCTPQNRPGPNNGGGLVERILVIPNSVDLLARSSFFRPTKLNGIITDIEDDNCEVTDTLAEPIAGTLPGQLAVECGDSRLTIRILEGDVNLDCQVDVADDQAIAMRYGSQLGLLLYQRWFDLEPKMSDDDIDIKDLQFLFGRNWSTCENPIPDDQEIPVAPDP